MPISFSNLLAERFLYEQSSLLKFIPLWKIVKIALQYDLKIPTLLKIDLSKWYFLFLHRRALKISSYNYSHFALVMG